MFQWIWVHGKWIYFWYTEFSSFRHISWGGTTWSFGNLVFHFLRNLHITFYQSYATLHSQCAGCLLCTPSAVFFFLIWVVSAGVRRYLIVLLICISINISDFEHFDVPVRAEKHPFSSFDCIKIRSFVCTCTLPTYVSNIFWILTPYQIYT